MTTAITLEDLQRRTPEIMQELLEKEETVVVRLADGRCVALVPDVDYETFDETAHLLSTPANRAALAQSLQEDAEGKTVEVKF